MSSAHPPSNPDADNDSRIDEAVACLAAGGVIGLPTETVYGLAADATNAAAVRRVFALKGRPADHPLIVHIADASALERWAIAVPDVARRLAQQFWPGPLTMILRRNPALPDLVTGGRDTVGLRVPSHVLAREVLRRFADRHDGAVAAPSANRFGGLSPTWAEHVRSEFGGAVDLVLDGGPCSVGIESTIVDVSSGGLHVLRPGDIDVAALMVCAGEPVDEPPEPTVAAPGTLPSHYAPVTPLRLCTTDSFAALRETIVGPVAVLLRNASRFSGSHVTNVTNVTIIEMPDAAEDYARGLYARLREADAGKFVAIIVEQPPDSPSWWAVRDRLRRAAAATAVDAGS